MDNTTQAFAKHRKTEHKLVFGVRQYNSCDISLFSKKEILKLKIAYIKLA